MPNFDDFKLSVEALSGGKNTVILDDRGLPSVMVRIPSMKNKDLITSSAIGDKINGGFVVHTVQKKEMLVSKFINVVMGDRAYSLPFKDPAVNVNFDNAVKYCRNKGKGWGLMPYSLWCAIALWSRANKTMPRGNNKWGCDTEMPHERGVETCKEGGSGEHKDDTARTATGSGPDTWNHNWLPDGIADMNGNVWEWTAGMRTNNGELQIIADADVMDSEVSLGADSTYWHAMKADGTLVAPNTADSLKWDWVTDKMQLTTGTLTTTEDAGHGAAYYTMTLKDSLTAPDLAKLLLFYPDTTESGTYGGDWHWVNTHGERLPICGGSWRHTGSAGVFDVHLGHPRTSAYGNVGFRSAYCEL